MGNILIKQARSSGPGSTSIIRSKEKSSGKLDGRALARNVDAIKCSPESDGTTTYVQKKEWDENVENYKFPPYVDCEYVN
jgi:hypothetical protein